MDETPFSGAAEDEDLAREIADNAEAESLPRDRASRFYDRIRKTTHSYLDRKSRVAGKAGEFLLLVPDVFILLWRLTTDSRVNSKDKVLLGSAVAYYIMPFDLIPEAIVGPIGYLDDLVFGVMVLSKVLSSVDAAVVQEHWSGSEDVLVAIKRVLNAAEGLIGSDLVSKIKKMIMR
ncbi:MAG TPA: DUF1232 domain-containing protein [Thermoanaerobaculia bacterium]|nr:DUF1232 domain-containing protein [Thermoanaerobaculia bacterium]